MKTIPQCCEGRGLDMSIVKFIVDAHKGTIDVESKPGIGKLFYCEIADMKKGFN